MLNGLPAYCSIRTNRIDALGENRADGTFKVTSLKGSPNLGTSNLSGVEHGNLETVKTLVAHQWKKSQVLQSKVAGPGKCTDADLHFCNPPGFLIPFSSGSAAGSCLHDTRLRLTA